MTRKEILIENSVQSFFFDRISDINKKSSPKLSSEIVHYMSLVMERYLLAENFFEERDGKLSEKWLGMKLLSSGECASAEKKRVLKDVGDTVLFLCGYFSPSLNRKIVNQGYYLDLGKMAYQRLDGVVPLVYEIRSFYKHIASQLEQMTNLLTVVAHAQKDLFPAYVITKKAS